MTEKKTTTTAGADRQSDSKGGEDAGQAELQRRDDEATEKGYIGEKPAGPDNEEWSLQSGPDSPTVKQLQDRGYLK
jgi:hypothetical protein